MFTKLGYTAAISRNDRAVLENCGYKGKQCHSLQCIKRQKWNPNFSLFKRFDSEIFKNCSGGYFKIHVVNYCADVTLHSTSLHYFTDYTDFKINNM